MAPINCRGFLPSLAPGACGEGTELELIDGSPAGGREPALPGCCDATGTCGVNPSQYLSIVPILPACIDLAPSGYFDPTCPVLVTNSGSYYFDGCCAFDGSCGITLDKLGLGCQTDAQFGIY